MYRGESDFHPIIEKSPIFTLLLVCFAMMWQSSSDVLPTCAPLSHHITSPFLELWLCRYFVVVVLADVLLPLLCSLWWIFCRPCYSCSGGCFAAVAALLCCVLVVSSGCFGTVVLLLWWMLGRQPRWCYLRVGTCFRLFCLVCQVVGFPYSVVVVLLSCWSFVCYPFL